MMAIDPQKINQQIKALGLASALTLSYIEVMNEVLLNGKVGKSDLNAIAQIEEVFFSHPHTIGDGTAGLHSLKTWGRGVADYLMRECKASAISSIIAKKGVEEGLICGELMAHLCRPEDPQAVWFWTCSGPRVSGNGKVYPPSYRTSGLDAIQKALSSGVMPPELELFWWERWTHQLKHSNKEIFAAHMVEKRPDETRGARTVAMAWLSSLGYKTEQELNRNMRLALMWPEESLERIPLFAKHFLTPRSYWEKLRCAGTCHEGAFQAVWSADYIYLLGYHPGIDLSENAQHVQAKDFQERMAWARMDLMKSEQAFQKSMVALVQEEGGIGEQLMWDKTKEENEQHVGIIKQVVEKHLLSLGLNQVHRHKKKTL